ncbi:hypothetical protein M3Y94_00863600 [Aphelenchoides besseyi]|nr:hypothetical protein M3Y94_00863600 [Aphelenchoides besseyi]KAI6226724.1 hypothetical protein M3Y95_00650900 [Aphelenchoides besseyi]
MLFKFVAFDLLIFGVLFNDVEGYGLVDFFAANGQESIVDMSLFWCLATEMVKSTLLVSIVGLPLLMACGKTRSKEGGEKHGQTEMKQVAAKEAEVKLQPTDYFVVPNQKPTPQAQGSVEQKSNKPQDKNPSAMKSPDWKGLASSNALA